MLTAGVHGVSPCRKYFLASAKSQYMRGSLACFWRSQAAGLTDAKAKPGGTIQPFCEQLSTTSQPQASVLRSTDPTELIASTTRSFPRDFTAGAISASGLVTPVEVSLCVTSTVVMAGSASSAAPI